MSFQSIYEPYLINKHLSIVKDKGEFPLIKIDNEFASASISIYGAQVLSYKSKSTDVEINSTDATDLLFVSDAAYFEQGKAIKGGIPICWPWFGRDPENPDKQMHGFVRNLLWDLEETTQLESGETRIILTIGESDETLKLWPNKFKLKLIVEVGSSLKLSLTTMNTGDKTFTITQALHAYFSVSHINNVKLVGLNGSQYLDKVTEDDQLKTQNGDIIVSEEVDRIYINSSSQLALKDKEKKRTVSIKSTGSKTTVVWNPWIEISRNSADLTDNAYLQFICVETANAAEDIITIAPNESFTIEAKYLVS